MSEVTIDQLAAARADGAYVVDVREPAEFREGHVPGATNIPMGQLTARLGGRVQLVEASLQIRHVLALHEPFGRFLALLRRGLAVPAVLDRVHAREHALDRLQVLLRRGRGLLAVLDHGTSAAGMRARIICVFFAIHGVLRLRS